MVFVAAEALGGVAIVPFSFSAGAMEERDARGGTMVACGDRPATGHSICWHCGSWLTCSLCTMEASSLVGH